MSNAFNVDKAQKVDLKYHCQLSQRSYITDEVIMAEEASYGDYELTIHTTYVPHNYTTDNIK